MFQWMAGIVTSLGYMGIALLMLLENIVVFIPSELIMPLAGFVAGRGDLSLWLVVLSGWIGSLAGAIPWYFAARFIGEERLTHWADTRGRWLPLRGRDLDRATAWFDRHGHFAVFLARITPGIRPLIGLPAGFDRMPFLPFLLYSALGTLLWVTALAYAGSLLGVHYTKIRTYLEPATWAILGALVLFVIIWMIAKVRKRKRQV
ncbi:MAG TPA: DedA family protein [Gemmatimonadaceae bacterium]|nr:DedA family protein [Gemmatimonadaceae bacterium]